MAQKINPISLRLGKTNRGMDCCWFNQSNYVNLLMKDFKIQKYIDLILKKIKFSSARYLIIYLPTKIKINIFFCNPNKNRKYASKIFYLSYPKKHKIIRKNFFNNAHAGVSVAQNKIFEYLTKNFNTNLFFSYTNKKSTELVFKNAKNNSAIKNENNVNNLFLFQNYLKLLHCLKKYNEFSIRYFLVKYFCIKQNFSFSKKEKFLASAFCITQKEKNYFTTNSLNNMYNAVLFKYIMFFLFLKIYKNKNFLALNYFQIKINNYKKITQSCNAFSRIFAGIKKKTSFLLAKEKLNINKNNFLSKNQLKKAVYTFNCEKKNNCNKLNVGVKTKLPIIFFFTTFLPLKLKILEFLKKKTLSHTFLYDFSTKKASTLDFFLNTNLGKKFVPTFHNANAFIKFNAYYKQLQFFNRPFVFSHSKSTEKFFLQENLIYFTSKMGLTNDNHINEKHCSLSLMNAEYVNKTYNNYCKLLFSSKYYNSIYSGNTNNSFSFIENTKASNNTNSFETTAKLNSNMISSKFPLIERKKCVLQSSLYKSHMEFILCNNFCGNVHLHFFQTSDIFKNALFVVDEIIYYIEKRVAFFKIKNYILKKITEQKSNYIQGIRVMCSGRIGGKSKKAQRCKVQNFKYGETSLHVFSSKIDFKSKNAFTSFGTLGIKVWICYN